MTMTKILSILELVAALTICRVWAHGSLKWPPSWHDPKGAVGLRTGFKNDACSAGCEEEFHLLEVNFQLSCSCMWYEQESPLPQGQQTLLPTDMRSMPDGYVEIPGGFPATPASAPGRGKVSSPCGLMGGTLQGTINAVKRLQSEGYDIHLDAGEAVKKGYGRDARAENLKDVLTTEWAQGSVVEVAFGLNAMHGGVYGYRLCKRPDSLMDLTEECFQAGALPFHGSQQWYQFGADASHRRALTAKRWKDASTGAEWTRLPIPSCSNHDGQTCDGPMFDPPYGIYGYGGDAMMDGFQVNVVDALKLPDDLTPGDYVLGFRWDVEDGGQAWVQCANVAVIDASKTPAQFVQPPLPRGIQQLTRFRKGGPMSQAHCEMWCAADDNCLALEMSGCAESQACHGSCYHFYTLDFDQAISHPDSHGFGTEVLQRFVKQGTQAFVPASAASSSSITTAVKSSTGSNSPTNPKAQPQPESKTEPEPEPEPESPQTMSHEAATSGVSSKTLTTLVFAVFLCILTQETMLCAGFCSSPDS